jgi:hypothetical protein
VALYVLDKTPKYLSNYAVTFLLLLVQRLCRPVVQPCLERFATPTEW